MTAKRTWLAVAAAAVAIGLTLTSHARPPEGPIQVRIWKNVMVPMRDGVRLATDVYLPNGETTPPGPFPTILIRHPYGKIRSGATAEFFTTHGYAAAIQDTRGRYDSEGEFYIYVNEGEDGYDAVEWIAAQPWSSGDVGTYGGSYGAACQNALAALRPPHLRTMFAYVGTSNYIEDGAGRGGAFALLHNMAYGFRLAQLGKEAESGDPDQEEESPTRLALNRANEQLANWLMRAPLKSTSPLSWAPSYAKWYADWRAHPTYDDYWKQNGYNFEERYAQYPDIPICFIGGWYDIFKRGTLKNFQGLSGRQGYVHLEVGPWTHSTGRTYAGDVDFGPEVKMTLKKKAVKWFDQFLKGKDLGLEQQPPVKYFVMGAKKSKRNEKGRLQSGGAWKSSETWPPAGSRQLRLYLHGDGSLRREPPGEPGTSGFEYDPRRPVPTIGGNIDSGKQLVRRGAHNQTPIEGEFAATDLLPLSSRSDVLSFQTPPLEEDLEIAGPMRVELWVSSTAKDTDFTAKLMDVYPPSTDYPEGYAMNLEDGILRMRFRESREREHLMEPGAVYRIEIDLWDTANRFHKGHRVRLDISSSNFPFYDVNPNTGEFLGRHTHMKTAVNTVYHAPDGASALVLTVPE